MEAHAQSATLVYLLLLQLTRLSASVSIKLQVIVTVPFVCVSHQEMCSMHGWHHTEQLPSDLLCIK